MAKRNPTSVKKDKDYKIKRGKKQVHIKIVIPAELLWDAVAELEKEAKRDYNKTNNGKKESKDDLMIR